jgi:hypothetical protein
MKIFGRTFDERDHIGSQYAKSRLLDDSADVYIHGPSPLRNVVVYGCSLCHRPYRLWLCADRVWNTLPPDLLDRHLCQECFIAIRGYLRLQHKLRKKQHRRCQLTQQPIARATP